MSGHQHRVTRVVLLALLIVCMLNLQTCHGVEGRYLPTRGDDSRQQQIKGMIKELLELNENEVPLRRPRFYYPYDLFQGQMKRSNLPSWQEERR